MFERSCVNLRLDKFEKELKVLNEKRLHDQKLIHQVSHQRDALFKDKESLIKINKNMAIELNALRSKLEKTQCKCLHYFFNSNYCVFS